MVGGRWGARGLLNSDRADPRGSCRLCRLLFFANVRCDEDKFTLWAFARLEAARELELSSADTAASCSNCCCCCCSCSCCAARRCFNMLHDVALLADRYM